jgi:hypothetical protein
LGLEADEVPFHHTTLSVFRSRLVVNDADERVLRFTLERAVGVGLFPKKVLGIANSIGVMGAAAVADTYELIREAIAKVIGAAGGADVLPKKLRRRPTGSSTARPAPIGRIVLPGGLSWAAWSRATQDPPPTATHRRDGQLQEDVHHRRRPERSPRCLNAPARPPPDPPTTPPRTLSPRAVWMVTLLALDAGHNPLQRSGRRSSRQEESRVEREGT